MCGIFGVYSLQTGIVEREIFQGLALLNVWRGKDSTGLVRINGKNAPITTARRYLLPSNQALGHPKFREVLDEKTGIGYIGHTRAATKGKVELKNAHPFTFPNVVGVHNGTIRWDFRHSKEYGTDSEAIYRNINDYGIDDTLTELSDSDPAYVLVYVDRRDKTLNFVRNKERPLYFTYLFNRTTLVWSSQWEMIDFVLERRNITTNEGYEAGKKGSDGYFTLPANRLMTLGLGKSAKEVELRQIEVPEPKKKTYSYGSYDWQQEWVKQEDGTYRKKSEGASHILGDSDSYDNFRDRYGAERLSSLPWLEEQVERSEREKAKKNEEASKGGNKKGENKGFTSTPRIIKAGGAPQSQQELRFRLSQGCFCCGVVVDYDNTDAVNHVSWWNREHYACKECFNSEEPELAWVRSAILDDWPNMSTLQ